MIMKKIEARIVADSMNKQGNRITTFILTYPRFIHAEVMTHRMFSRNAASSRAIPFDKMVNSIREEPFIPVVWQRDHKGMQGTEYVFPPKEIEDLRANWEEAARYAAADAEILHDMNITKQICNRILEPFMWYTALVTATEWDNFFELRLPKYVVKGKVYKTRKEAMDNLSYMPFKDWTDAQWMSHSKAAAEPHMQMLAEAMYDAMQVSTPNVLKAGEWHIPFGDKMDDEAILEYTSHFKCFEMEPKIKRKIAVARCARLSYMTYDGDFSVEKDVELHDRLLKSRHLSPFEHVARCMTEDEYDNLVLYEKTKAQYGKCRNFTGFIQYRVLAENE